MNILIACEMSGRVRDAFLDRGHFAMSCDLLPELPGSKYARDEMHYQGDVFDLLREPWLALPGGQGHSGEWDMVIAFPPCTHLAGSGARWLTDHWVKKKTAPGGRYWHDGTAKRLAQWHALEFVKRLWRSRRTDGALIPRIAVENPVGMLSSLWRKPNQIIQPWEYWTGAPGQGEVKKTCLWLCGLPRLTPTTPQETGRHQACWLMPPGPDRAMLRSLTYPGIALAMAAQWGD